MRFACSPLPNGAWAIHPSTIVTLNIQEEIIAKDTYVSSTLYAILLLKCSTWTASLFMLETMR